MFAKLYGVIGGAVASVIPPQAKGPAKAGLSFIAGVLVGKYAEVGYVLQGIADAIK